MMRVRGLLVRSVMLCGVIVCGSLLWALPALAVAPEVQSESLRYATPYEARVEAEVNPGEEATECNFLYGEASVSENEVPCEPEATLGGGPQGTRLVIGGLTPETTYHYRVLLENATGEVEGAEESFTTPAADAPVIEAESAKAITRTGAELRATINPEYQETTYQFKLGIGASFDLTAPASPAILSSPGEFGEFEASTDLQSDGVALKPNTEYDYEVLATDRTGTSEVAATEPFLTLPEPPTVSTERPTAVSPRSATVSASVDPGSSGTSSAQKAQDDTTYYIEYGGTTAYGKRTPTLTAGEGEHAIPVTVSLQALEPGVTYHYRIVASNDNANTEGLPPQTVYGQDETFTTTATPPLLSGVTVQGVSQNAVTITATLDPRGLPTRYELRLGSTPGALLTQTAGDTSSTTPVTVTLSSVEALSPGTVYYYKLTATNANGPAQPEPQGSFTTLPAGPAGPAPATLPATIPYTSIAALDAKETKEDKSLPGPAITKTLTNTQKLKKALKACRKQRAKSKRLRCETRARKRYRTTKKKR